MPKDQFNWIKQNHRSLSIEDTFDRIKDELFKPEYLQLAKEVECEKELVALRDVLAEFEEILFNDSRISKKSIREKSNIGNDYAIKTACLLDDAISNFFFYQDPEARKKAANDFFVGARGAKFSQRTKTVAAGVIGGLLVFGLLFGLIIGTGGIALLGFWTVLGISVGLGLLGGMAFSFLGYKLSHNDLETHGEDVKNALIALNGKRGLSMFIQKRNNGFTLKEGVNQKKDYEGLISFQQRILTRRRLPKPDQSQAARPPVIPGKTEIVASLPPPIPTFGSVLQPPKKRIVSFDDDQQRQEKQSPAPALQKPSQTLTEPGNRGEEKVSFNTFRDKKENRSYSVFGMITKQEKTQKEKTDAALREAEKVLKAERPTGRPQAPQPASTSVASKTFGSTFESLPQTFKKLEQSNAISEEVVIVPISSDRHKSVAATAKQVNKDFQLLTKEEITSKYGVETLPFFQKNKQLLPESNSYSSSTPTNT